MLALGYDGALIKKLFTAPGPLEQSKAKAEPLLFSTSLYMEYRIAKELNMTHAEYRKLPRKEQRTWYFFHILEAEKERYAYDKAKKDAEQEATQKAPKPSSRIR